MSERRYRLLDLFSGAGGSAVGYARSGFEVVGIDCAPQKHYPFEFHIADALEYVQVHGREFDVIHASPPCQGYSRVRTMHTVRNRVYPMLIPQLQKLLQGRLYVIENVEGAPLHNPVLLCGLSFDLKLFRHRLFECPILLTSPPHQSHKGHKIGEGGFVCMAGHGDSGRGRIPWTHRCIASWRNASGIDWMTRAEMAQAIPPAYTFYLGLQLKEYLRKGAIIE